MNLPTNILAGNIPEEKEWEKYFSPKCDTIEFLSIGTMMTGSIPDWEYDDDVVS